MPVPFVLIGRFLGAGILSAIEANEARLALGMATKGLAEGETQMAEGAPQTPLFVPVNSTAIRGVAYIPEDTIVVEFVRGGTYTYDGSLELFTAFVTAPSKGQFFNQHFRDANYSGLHTALGRLRITKKTASKR